mgnify:CR=1 FL=1
MRPLINRLFGKRKSSEAQELFFSPSIKEIRKQLEQGIFAQDDSIVYRTFFTAEPHGRECLIVYPEAMTSNDFVSEFVVKPLSEEVLEPGLRGSALAAHLMEHVLPISAVKEVSRLRDAVDDILTGDAALFVDGCASAFILPSKSVTIRLPTEPSAESVVRGPREAFCESLAVNITLVRRRIRTPMLKFSYMQLGRQTQTKVAIAHIEGIAAPAIVEEVHQRLSEIEIDGIIDSGYIEELIQDAPLSPFKTIGHTERPDIVAARLLEGRVAILVDGTPVALTMPFLFVESLQANEDYFKHFAIASVDRLIRYICLFLSTSTPAIYLALVAYHPILIPTQLALSISASRQGVPFPAVIEVFMMGLIFEIMREGGVRLPGPIGQALSIVGAIVLGDAAVQAQIVSAPMIIVVAITAISGFAVPKIYGVMVLLRAFFSLCAGLLGLYGYFVGVIAVTIHLMSLRSFGVPYMVNYTDFDPQNIKDTAMRVPWWHMRLRPRLLAARNPQRLREDGER